MCPFRPLQGNDDASPASDLGSFGISDCRPRLHLVIGIARRQRNTPTPKQIVRFQLLRINRSLIELFTSLLFISVWIAYVVAVQWYPDDASRWTAVRAKDPIAEKAFVYCVKTTKIYCRPVCQARLARRANVVFFPDAARAEAAGYRACKRCHPQHEHTPEAGVKIAKACAILDSMCAEAPLPRLEELAASVGLTKSHFHRSFKKTMGWTPKEYVISRRCQLLSQVESIQPACAIRTSPGCASIPDTPSMTWSSMESSASTTTPDTPVSPDGRIVGSWDAEYQYSRNTSELTSFPNAQELDELIATSILPDHLSPSPDRLQVHYSCVETTLGILLVAFEDDQLVKLELAATICEYLDSLEASFPSSVYALVPIQSLGHSVNEAVQQQVDSIVEALEQPTGKVLSLKLSPHLQSDLFG